MATGGSRVSPDTAEDQRNGVKTLLAPTSLIVPVDSSTGQRTLKALGEPAEPKQDGDKVCQFFMMGKCHFGLRCRLSHSDPSAHDSGDVSSDVNDKQDREKMEKQKKKEGSADKAAKPKHEEEKGLDKKPRMRTADDVISRILWDPSVDASEFVVGYVDRFLGVLERPFCDFSWDTNPCDCDYSAELALPRHRIQYFTYRGLRVWDRHTRTDRVFGSTGQSLAPPFGGEEEVNGENIPQDQEEQLDNPGTAEDQPAAVSGQYEGETEDLTHSKNSHLEEDELNEMIHTKDATHSAAECEENTCQKSRGACVVEEAANRLQTSSEQMFSFQEEELAVKEKDEEENDVEWEESWEGNGDTQSELAALQLNQNPSGSPKLAEEKHGGRPPKKQPTHFITFRANTPAILSCFQQLQEELTTLLPSSAPHWQTASKLHVTLCLLVLRGPAEVAAAGEILRQFARFNRSPPVAVTFPVKLKHFNGKVLYLSPQPQLHLQQLNSALQEAYRKEGWLHRSSYNPRYHLNLAKVADAEGERIFERVGDMKAGKGLNFGRLPVNSLHLCAMNGTRVDGFYDTVCTVTLR